jgi:hypothetical protein
MRFTGHVALMGWKSNEYGALTGKPGRNRLLGRLRCRWEDNIEMGLTETGYSEMNGLM